jgi:hypothetical protein
MILISTGHDRRVAISRWRVQVNPTG